MRGQDCRPVVGAVVGRFPGTSQGQVKIRRFAVGGSPGVQVGPKAIEFFRIEGIFQPGNGVPDDPLDPERDFPGRGQPIPVPGQAGIFPGQTLGPGEGFGSADAQLPFPEEKEKNRPEIRGGDALPQAGLGV